MFFKVLDKEDCIKMEEIDASQYIDRAWREVDGERILVDIDYYDPSWPNGFENHFNDALASVNNGLALGCFEGGMLIGILTIEPMEKWNEFSYALLDQLFISKPFRGKGIGTKLFKHALNHIQNWSIDRILICAGSAEETIAFYKKLGCVEVGDKNLKLYEDDPKDIQLEYKIDGFYQ